MLWALLAAISGGFQAERDFECLTHLIAAGREIREQPAAAAIAATANFFSGRLSTESNDRDYQAQANWEAGKIKAADAGVIKQCVRRMAETQGLPQPNQ